MKEETKDLLRIVYQTIGGVSAGVFMLLGENFICGAIFGIGICIMVYRAKRRVKD